MKKEDLFSAIGQADEKYIKHADSVFTGDKNENKSRVMTAVKAVASVAAAVLIIGSVWFISMRYAVKDPESTAAEQSEPEQTEPEQTESAFKDIYDIPGALTKNSDCYQGYWPKNLTYKPMTPEQYVESCKNNHAILVYGEIKNLKTITVNVDALDMYCEPIVNTWAIYTFDVEIEQNILGECDKEVVRLIAANMIRESTDISTSLSYSSSYLSLQEGKKALFSIRRPDELTDQPFIIDIDPLEYADYYAKLQCKCDGETFIYSGWVENFALPLSVFSDNE